MTEPTILDFYESTLQYVHVRIHTSESMDYVKNTFANFLVYVISFENGIRDHYHVLLGDNRKEMFGKKDNNALRYLIKKSFKSEGNKDYSLSTVKNQSNMKSYILKGDLEYAYKGISEEKIKLLKFISYKKFNPKDFQVEKEEIRIKYLKGEYTLADTFDAFGQLKLQYNQEQGWSNIPGMIESWFMKKNGTRRWAEENANRLISKHQYYGE